MSRTRCYAAFVTLAIAVPAWTALAAGQPNPPPAANRTAFTKPIAHDAEFFPTTKDFLRRGDMMRATVIRNDRKVAMTTDNPKWQTRIQWLNAANLPGLRKALTFSALADVKALLKDVPADVRIIEYNMERNMTPEEDFADIAQTVVEISRLVRASGRTFAFGPIRATWDVLEKDGKLATVVNACDSVGIQMQRVLQSRENAATSIVDECRTLQAKFKGLNPQVEVNIQLWLGRQNVEQMVAGFRAIQPHIDYAVLGTHSNPTGVLEVLKQLRGAAK